MARADRKAAAKSVVAAAIVPMEAKLVEALPAEPGWQFEPKWDGFRCIVVRAGDMVALQAKSGKPLARYFPEMVAAIRELPFLHFVLDGELTIPVGDSISFDSLQMRLHPAESRIRKLAAETPSMLILFDILATPEGESLTNQPFQHRREALEAFVDRLPSGGPVRLSPYTRDLGEAEDWLARAGGSLDGVIAKRLDDSYHPGERTMLKIKKIRSADCVVGGFRYGTESKLAASLLLGLFNDDGKLDHVGFTSGIPGTEREELTEKLEALQGGPGFTGKAPGGPSRWQTERSTEWVPLRHDLVVEVLYDHITGDRFRHGTKLLRWRPDKAPSQCTFEQLQAEARPGRLITDVIAPVGR